VYLINVHLSGVHLMGVYLMGVYLTGVHLTGVHLMGVHLKGVHLLVDLSRSELQNTNLALVAGGPPQTPHTSHRRWHELLLRPQ
jgi:uncharacterized protein YjbI with pentapeptide repeats